VTLRLRRIWSQDNRPGIIMSSFIFILSLNKRQATVETSTYGSGYPSDHTIEGLRYKIRMLGLPMEGPANGFLRQRVWYWTLPYPLQRSRRNTNAVNLSQKAGVDCQCWHSPAYKGTAEPTFQICALNCWTVEKKTSHFTRIHYWVIWWLHARGPPKWSQVHDFQMVTPPV
jgi:hypothetical protein